MKKKIKGRIKSFYVNLTKIATKQSEEYLYTHSPLLVVENKVESYK